MRKINTGDVFKMARLLKNGNIVKNIKDAYTAGKQEGADTETVGLNAIMDIMCSCADANVEDQFYDLLGGICEKKADEVKNQSLESTIADIKKICEANDVGNFFKSAVSMNSKMK
jgi:hypothetical protein